jgi:hypothetical protein
VQNTGDLSKRVTIEDHVCSLFLKGVETGKNVIKINLESLVRL